MSDDRNRPEPDATEEPRPERQEGQVSEMEAVGPEAGGADATDKSTGTAPKGRGRGAHRGRGGGAGRRESRVADECGVTP